MTVSSARTSPLNVAMTAEQIDVATGATEVSISVEKARQWGCFAPTRLNRIENEAPRIKQEVAGEGVLDRSAHFLVIARKSRESRKPFTDPEASIR